MSLFHRGPKHIHEWAEVERVVAPGVTVNTKGGNVGSTEGVLAFHQQVLDAAAGATTILYRCACGQHYTFHARGLPR